MGIADNIERIKSMLGGATLVAVSKYSSDEEVQTAYDAGQRDFGENKAQDLDARRQRFPEDVRWHFIGHLQRNKVKFIAPYVHLIHAVDSPRLLKEIDKQAAKNDRIIDCLLQVHIAREESKFGLDVEGARTLAMSEQTAELKNIRVCGLMGMATFTDNEDQISAEFESLSNLYDDLKAASLPHNVAMEVLSMGMTNDYRIAIAHGSNLVRMGSAVFPQDLKSR